MGPAFVYFPSANDPSLPPKWDETTALRGALWPHPPRTSPDRRSASIYFPARRGDHQSSSGPKWWGSLSPLMVTPPSPRRYLLQQIANYPGEAGKRHEPPLDWAPTYYPPRGPSPPFGSARWLIPGKRLPRRAYGGTGINRPLNQTVLEIQWTRAKKKKPYKRRHTAFSVPGKTKSDLRRVSAAAKVVRMSLVVCQRKTPILFSVNGDRDKERHHYLNKML